MTWCRFDYQKTEWMLSLTLRPHGSSFCWLYRRKLHCQGILGKNPIFKGEMPWFHKNFTELTVIYPKDKCSGSYRKLAPTSYTLVSKNLSTVHLLHNTCGSNIRHPDGLSHLLLESSAGIFPWVLHVKFIQHTIKHSRQEQFLTQWLTNSIRSFFDVHCSLEVGVAPPEADMSHCWGKSNFLKTFKSHILLVFEGYQSIWNISLYV